MSSSRSSDGILSADQIKMLLTVVECGSFSKAADVLGVKQPAITQQASRLEQRLGRQLFARSASGIRLTQDGEAVLIYARTVQSLGADLLRQLNSSADDTYLRIGMNEDFARSALPNVLAMFLRQIPSFRISATCGTGRELFNSLDRGDLDIVISRNATDEQRGELLWTTDTVWFGQPTVETPVSEPLRLILLAQGSLRDEILSTLQSASRMWRVVFESGSLALVSAAMRAGLGIGALARGTRLLELEELDAEKRDLPRLPPSRFVFATSGARKPSAVDVFNRVLKEAVRQSFSMGTLKTDGKDS